jgi:hypothetical protein
VGEVLAWSREKLDSVNTKTKRWAGLGMLAGLLIALAAWLIPRGGDSGPNVGAAQRPSNLELVDLLVKEAGGGSRLEVTLHNTGERRVVIDGARIEIRRVYEAGHCYPQGDLPLSNSYGVQLPPDSSPGTELKAPLHQQLGADQADRFAISFGLPESDMPPPVNYLFELDLSLTNDGPAGPLPLGGVQVSLPYAPAPGEDFWVDGSAEYLAAEFDLSNERSLGEFRAAMRCWRANTAVLEEAFSHPAVRSPNLDAISDLMVKPSFAAVEAASG